MNRKSILLRVLLISWATGLGSRFIFEFLIENKNIYTPNLFDLVFDWSGLIILGILNLILLIYEYYAMPKVNSFKK